MTLRFCYDCGCKVEYERMDDYRWYCPNCYQSLYNIDTDTVDELSIAEVLYGLYLHDWVKTHDEGEPVCYEEFMDNEYYDEEYMMYLRKKYNLKL